MGATCRIGIVLGRCGLAGARVEGARTVRCGEVPLSAERSTSQTLAALLTELKATDPSVAAQIRLALSPSHCACAERIAAPARGVALETVAGSMAEGLSAGEVLEDLTVAHGSLGAQTEIVAVRTACLREWIGAIESVWPGARLSLITSLPSLVARWSQVKDSETRCYCGGGDAIVCGAKTWRAFPVSWDNDQARTQVAMACGSTEPPAYLDASEGLSQLQAAAVALTRLDADEPPNLLLPLGKVQGAAARRISKSLFWAWAGAALLFLALGLTFEQRRRAYEDALAEVDRAEQRLWASAQPEVKAREGRLANVLLTRVRQQERASRANELPSALAFWSELAAGMPHPNKLGLNVESFSLSRTEGRLIGQVQAAPDDPLKHAAELEAALNLAPSLSARGEFETQKDAVSVRLWLDYRPSKREATGSDEDAP